MRLLAMLCALLGLLGCGRRGGPPLRTVDHVDLARYQGDWYVIANIPYALERGKVATFDRYRLRPDGRMDNEFHFRRGSFDAEPEVWRGVAWVHDRRTNAEWRVRFIWPFTAAYLIIDLDPEYRWAVIGHPSRALFWVLARERALPEPVYEGILLRAAAQGYDVGRVERVPQPVQTPE
jgi:apolipoprotein D and lipocalin family protein